MVFLIKKETYFLLLVLLVCWAAKICMAAIDKKDYKIMTGEDGQTNYTILQGPKGSETTYEVEFWEPEIQKTEKGKPRMLPTPSLPLPPLTFTKSTTKTATNEEDSTGFFAGFKKKTKAVKTGLLDAANKIKSFKGKPKKKEDKSNEKKILVDDNKYNETDVVNVERTSDILEDSTEKHDEQDESQKTSPKNSEESEDVLEEVEESKISIDEEAENFSNQENTKQEQSLPPLLQPPIIPPDIRIPSPPLPPRPARMSP